MAIRFLLVTLVAGLGLELPSRDEVSSMMNSGRTWIAARMDDWSVTNTRRVQEANDRAFTRIVNEMSRDFSRDLAQMEAKNKPATLLAAQPFEPIVVADVVEQDLVAQLIATATSPDDRIEVADEADAQPADDRIEVADAPSEGPAEELNRLGESVNTAAEQVIVAKAPEAPAASLTVSEPAETKSSPAVAAEANVGESSTGRTKQIASAIRLTREAMGAWASLLRGSEAIVRR